MKLLKLLLNLHEDGAAPASAATASTDAETAEATVIYGVGEEQPTTEATPETKETKQEETAEKKSFEDLIKEEYKDEFEKKAQSIINERFKVTKTLQENLDKMSPILKTLSIRYGVKEGDVDALNKAIENDPNLLTEQAQAHGVSVDQLIKLKDYENLQAQVQKQAQKQKIQAESDAIVQKWADEFQQLKTTYPDFNPTEAMKNPIFSQAMRAGLPATAAYTATYHDKLLKDAVKQSSAMTASNIAQKQVRHTEAGAAASTGVIHKTDVSAFTDKDMEETRRRAMNGEIISFSRRQ